MVADGELSGLARRVVEAAGSGAVVDLRTGDPAVDDPAGGAGWTGDRTVRAELVVELLTGTRVPDSGQVRAVRLTGAHLVGVLDLDAAALVCPLVLKNCYFDEPITLTEAQASVIRLPGCHLPGITAHQLHVRGTLELAGVVTTKAGVQLAGARIGGNLEFDGAILTNPNGRALLADSLTVDQNMLCREGFTAQGEVRLIGAHIGSQLSFTRASLTNPNGYALLADSLTVDQNMLCREGFTAQGEVRLVGAHIGRYLVFDGASLSKPDGVALSLQRARAGVLFLLPRERPDGVVDLTNARVGSFHDTPESWPAAMRLRGFTYEVLENDTVSVRARLGWLTRHQGGYAPGLYDQLAAAYRRTGHIEAARRVGIAKQWRRRGELKLLGKMWNWLLYLTVGYGYRTWLAGLWLAGLLAVGATIFAGAHPDQLRRASASVPEFQPVAYTLDVLLPIVDLGQEKAWYPQNSARVWAWVLTGAGWVLTTTVVAGLTNALKRD